MALTLTERELGIMESLTGLLSAEVQQYTKEDTQLVLDWLGKLQEICKQKLEENGGEQNPSVHTEPS